MVPQDKSKLSLLDHSQLDPGGEIETRVMGDMTIDIVEFSTTADTYFFIGRANEMVERREMAGYDSGDLYTLKDSVDLTTGDSVSCIKTLNGLNVIFVAKRSSPNMYLLGYNDLYLVFKTEPTGSGALIVDGFFNSTTMLGIALDDMSTNHLSFSGLSAKCKIYVPTNYYQCITCHPGYWLDGA